MFTLKKSWFWTIANAVGAYFWLYDLRYFLHQPNAGFCVFLSSFGLCWCSFGAFAFFPVNRALHALASVGAAIVIFGAGYALLLQDAFTHTRQYFARLFSRRSS